MLPLLIAGLLTACANPSAPPPEDPLVTAPDIPALLVALSAPALDIAALREQLGGQWTRTESDYFIDHQSTDAAGFERVQIREPGPRARTGAIIGLELSSEPCVTSDVLREALGPSTPSPARPGAPQGIQHQVFTQAGVTIIAGLDARSGCLVQASVRHPAPAQ